jgi:hypothetical protein
MPAVAGAELNQKFGTGRRQLPPSSLPTVRIQPGSQLHLGPSGSPCSSISAWPCWRGFFSILYPCSAWSFVNTCTPGGHVQPQQAPSDFILFYRGSCWWCKRCIYDVGLTSESPLLFLHFRFCQSGSVSGDLPSLGSSESLHVSRLPSRSHPFQVWPHIPRSAQVAAVPPHTKTRRPTKLCRSLAIAASACTLPPFKVLG